MTKIGEWEGIEFMLILVLTIGLLDLRIIPCLCVLYLLAFLDRSVKSSSLLSFAGDRTVTSIYA